MKQKERQARLQEDRERLDSLRDASSIFDFEAEGDAPERYVLVFRGKGIRRDRTAPGGVNFVEEHRCEIRMSYAYPDRPPDLRWISPTYHPNVTFSGFISLKDLGLPWEPDLGLDVVCERLWDVARMSYVDLENASNYNAKNWLLNECQIELPADPRPLRDARTESRGNVVRYKRKGEGGVTLPDQAAPAADDVFFIGNDTPASSAQASPPGGDDDDVFYIGYE